MEKDHPLNTPMVVQSLDEKKKTLFALKKMMKKFLILKYHILV
jgi:hypothetical protein